MNKARRILFFIALALIALVFTLELGSGFVFTPVNVETARPGIGIRYLALIDGLLLYSIILIAAPMLISHRLHGRIQGITTLIVSLIALMLTITMIVLAIALLSMMVAMLLAVPFGTIAYMAAFAHFPTGKAAAVLSAIFSLKVAFCCSLVMSQEQFLKNRGLMILILLSLGLTLLLGFLHSFPPGFIVSITDNIGAIVTAIVSTVWALIMLIRSIPAIIKALNVSDV